MIIKTKYISYSISIIALFAIVFNACKKESITETPSGTQIPASFKSKNIPKDTTKIDSTNVDTTNVDSSSFLGIHRNILATKCNNPGCHDGTFEPDFRTVQSSYTTLVYASTVKNTIDNINYFKYRVIPGDTLHSFIHERVTTSTSEYMPSNGTRLSRKEINHINKWIMNGAKDIYGNTPTAPDTLPQILTYIAFDDTTGIRIDTIRQAGPNSPSPFLVNKTQKVKLWGIYHDDLTPVGDFTTKLLKISTNKDDFSSAQVISSNIYLNYDPYFIWEFHFDAAQLTPNTKYYIRLYVSDGTHGSQVTELPTNNSPFYYKDIFSFFVNP